MEEKELLQLDLENFSKYVEERRQNLNISKQDFAEITKVSTGEISKIININKKRVSLQSFYNIAINSGDTISNARDFVYSHRTFELKIPVLRNRTQFGAYLAKNIEVEGKNTFEIILAKTDIPESRLTEIYYKNGAPDPYEFLLIEKAVGKKPGEMMKDYIEKHPIIKKTKEQ